MSSRLPHYDPADLDPDQYAFYAQYLPDSPRGRRGRSGGIPLLDAEGQLVGPSAAWLLNPAFGADYIPLGLSVRTRTGLSPRSQEIIILVVGHRLQNPFERYAHEAAARAIEMTEDEISALSLGTPITFADAEEQACYEVTQTLMSNGGLTDDEYAHAVEVLGEKGLFGVTAIIGWYWTVGLQMSVFNILPPT